MPGPLTRYQSTILPSVELWSEYASIAADQVIVTRRIGFTYILERILISAYAAPGSEIGLQVYIADDNDASFLEPLTGDPVINRVDTFAGHDRFLSYFRIDRPIELRPHKVVKRAPTYIKLRQKSVAGDPVLVCYSLIPVDPRSY